MPTLRIGNRVVGTGQRCYVVAEIGHNHQGDPDLARVMMKAAKEAGASAVKLQKRHLPTLLTAEFAAEPNPGEHSFGTTYGEHRAALELDDESWQQLADYARSIDLPFFATAFDPTSADFLAELKVPALKIASADALNWPLLDHAATLGLPLLVSTGGLDWAQLDATVERLTGLACSFAVLQCTSAYPCPLDQLELRTISAMQARYPDVVIGYSGHEEGIAPSLAAVALGAAVVERHVTVDRSLKGSDHRYSLPPAELSTLVTGIGEVQAALGTGIKRRFPSEQGALRKLGKKLVAARALPAGHCLTEADLAVRSPGDGISPHRLAEFTGRSLRRPLAAGADLDLSAFG